MVSTKLFQIAVPFLLCQMFSMVVPQHCDKGEYSIFGKMLRGHIFKKMKVSIPHECLQACNNDFRCRSFNYIITEDVCELNNRTKEARPEDFVPNFSRYYFKRNTKTVPLGSIPELPAQSCKEIKASEGGQAVSGKYWFDSVIPGKTIPLHCNMETEDADECNASIPVCDVINGICNNTLGSYHCSCEVGFTGDGKTCTDVNECSALPSVCDVNANCHNNEGSYVCSCNAGFYGDGKMCTVPSQSCAALRTSSLTADGIYQIKTSSSLFLVYCDMTNDGQGWTLVARFSNSDVKNWMKDTGEWWYDRTVAVGGTTDPSSNADMISTAFWQVGGTEFKITRSDDSQHTALLQTTGNCVGGQTFRSKITSYGNYRNGAVWASDLCRGNCAVQYGGQYQSTEGFKQATCSGELQSANFIGFWCDWGGGDGAVMMIGGGGSCTRADHGIGITEANAASFVFSSESDFGDESGWGTNSYSLNLWIR